MPHYTEANFSKADWEKLQTINAEKAAAQAARRQRRIEREKRFAEQAPLREAHIKRVAPLTAQIMALDIGQSCDIPAKEWARVYRLGKANGRVFKVITARGCLEARVTRQEPFKFAPIGASLLDSNEDLA